MSNEYIPEACHRSFIGSCCETFRPRFDILGVVRECVMRWTCRCYAWSASP